MTAPKPPVHRVVWFDREPTGGTVYERPPEAMTPERLAEIRKAVRLTAEDPYAYPLSVPQWQRAELLAEVDRLTSDLAAARAEIDRLRDGWEAMP